MPDRTTLQAIGRALGIALVVWLAWGLASLFQASPGHLALLVGEPSPRNIKAPYEVTFVSDVRTQQARVAAANRVEDIYSGPDMTVINDQLTLLESITEHISTIRTDTSLSQDEKIASIRSIESLEMDDRALTFLLTLIDQEWTLVVDESLRVTELIMRDEIRPNQVALSKRRAERLVTRSFTQDQLSVTVALAQNVIVANSLFDADQTEANKQAAQADIAPIQVTLRAGESILREGEIVTDLALEKLASLGMLDTGIDWQDALGQSILHLLLLVFLGAYLIANDRLLLLRPRREYLLGLVLLTVGVSARLIIPGRALLPYLFPAAAAAMVVALLLDIEMAIVVSIISAVLVGASAETSVELYVYAQIGSLIGALTLWHMDQIGSFIKTAVYLALVNVAIILAFGLSRHTYDAVGFVQLLAAGLINSLLSVSLAFLVYSFVGRVFGIATSLQLLELARPDHPLFRQVLIKAPGTYHHSIVVSNMAERAAQVIDADALLVRVGSYYHDVGKTIRPFFFTENQADGINPHDDLDPYTSAEIIIGHTTEGLRLAQKYRLPDRVCDFIPQHHGTTMVTYFYRQAMQQSDDQDVREDDFRYPGPRPQNRETAIVMLADSIEAWLRSNRPESQADMERIVRQVINNRLIAGELAECDLTLRDLDMIREAFISVLQGVYHARVKYPERVKRRSNGHS